LAKSEERRVGKVEMDVEIEEERGGGQEKKENEEEEVKEEPE